MKLQFATAAFLLVLTGCATTPEIGKPVAAPARPIAAAARSSSDLVIGQSAGRLQALFGTPSRQLTEGTARKLQFAGPTCVLDAYLYPPEAGGEPAVTHVDTRRPTGEDTDRASCIAALQAGHGVR